MADTPNRGTGERSRGRGRGGGGIPRLDDMPQAQAAPSSSSSSSSYRGRGGRGGYRGNRSRGRGKGRGGDAAAVVKDALKLEEDAEAAEEGGESSSSSPRELEGGLCVICTEPLDNKRHRPGVGPCLHTSTCALCFMRLRLLLKTTACAVCKAPLEHIYIFESPSDIRPYSTLNIWGTEAGPGMVYDDRSQMFMPKAFYQDVFLPIQAMRCGGTPTCE